MSLSDKLGGLMQRPNDDLGAKDDTPWWLKYSARGLGSVAGGFGLFLGLFNTVTSVILFSGMNGILSGILLSIAGFTAIVFEAPCCCMFVDYVQEASNWMDKRPNWYRAVYYMCAGAIPLTLSHALTIFMACALIFFTGMLYGIMALGKKATPEEMRTNAASIYATKNQQFPPASSHSNLVENVHPVSLTNPFDSPA